MPECTCRGLNPDCFKCEGRGWIDDPIVKHQGKPPVPTKDPPAELSSKPSGNSKNKKIELTPCPYCKEKVINLGYHIRYKHKNILTKEEERKHKEEEARKLQGPYRRIMEKRRAKRKEEETLNRKGEEERKQPEIERERKLQERYRPLVEEARAKRKEEEK